MTYAHNEEAKPIVIYVNPYSNWNIFHWGGQKKKEKRKKKKEERRRWTMNIIRKGRPM